MPSSDVLSPEIPKVLGTTKIDWTRAIMYRTVNSDLSDVDIKQYDMLVLFTPQGVRSLMENYKNFEQGDIKLAVFGANTQKEAEEAGLRVDVMAPTKECPSMTMALEKYIQKMNK